MSEERRKIASGLEDGSILILKTNTSVSVTDGLNTSRLKDLAVLRIL